MRKLIMPVAILISAATLLAATITPLDVKTGLWQVTMTTTIKGMPNPIVNGYQSCIKPEDLTKYPFTDPKAMCSWTVVSSTSSQMSATGTCMPAGMGKVDFSMELDATDTADVKGTGQMSFNGPAGAMTGTYAASAKWVGANCPANLK